MTHTLTIMTVTIDSTDPARIAAWWGKQLGSEATDHQGDGSFVVVPTGAVNLAFQRVADPTPGKNKFHFDIGTKDAPGAINALLAEGATRVADHNGGGFSWTVLADPDGNQFCVAAAD